MDPNPEILEQETALRVEAEADVAMGARDWPGVSRETEPEPVKFPGEDGGKSLAKMAERDLMAAVQLLAERAQYITGATGAAIALRDGDEMVCRASAGGSAPEIGARLQMDSGLSGESIRTRQLLRCNDAQTDGRVNRESCEALGIASVVVMPMLDGGEVIGVFELFSDRAYAFEDRDIVALERMGAMVRTALEQAEGETAAGGDRIKEEPVLAVASVEQEPESTEESVATFAPSEEIADLVGTEALEPEANAAAATEHTAAVETAVVPAATVQADQEKSATIPEDAAPAMAEGNEDAEKSLFLSIPSTAVDGAGSYAPELIQEKADAAEPDVGEMARDAAARTEAFKASLFASEAPAESESDGPSDSAGRIAFHMRVPRKIEAQPAEVGATAVAASAKAASQEKSQWETPVFESESQTQTQSQSDAPGTAAVEEHSSEPEVIVADAELSKPSNEPAGKVAEPAVERGLPVAAGSAGSAAAAAPAREIRANEVASAAKTEEKAAVAPAMPAASPVSKEPLTKPKIEIARPASSEGRAKIAVAQVRKCEACGFPVSEGRKLCLDCEKKAPKAASAKPDEALEPVAGGKTEPAVAAKEPLSAAVMSEAPVTAAETPALVAKTAEVSEKAASQPELRKSETGSSVGAAVAEPTAPQFLVNTDHDQSWIGSHKYLVAAIAVVVVGIVVYLLMR